MTDLLTLGLRALIQVGDATRAMRVRVWHIGSVSSRKVVVLSQVSPYVTASSIDITNTPKSTPLAQQQPEQARRDLVSRPPEPSSHPLVPSRRRLDPAHHLHPSDQ